MSRLAWIVRRYKETLCVLGVKGETNVPARLSSRLGQMMIAIAEQLEVSEKIFRSSQDVAGLSGI